MQRLLLGVAASAFLFVTAASADVIADRKAIMKEKNGASVGVLVKIMRGEMDYDAEAVMTAFKTMREGTEGYADLFPEDSMTGGETTASPKIWEDMDGFKAKLASFHADLDAAIAAEPADKEAFTPLFNQVASNCQSCHEAYRIMKN